MNLDNFSEKLRITVDAAFNYAKENSFNYFFPIHILIILLQDDNLISKTLKELKVNKQALLDESIKISNEQNNNSKETQVQSNVILLLNKINDQISKYKVSNSESLIALMELTSDISPVTKKILNKFGIKYEVLKNYLQSIKNDNQDQYDNIKKYTIDLTELAKNNKIDPIIGRESEIKRSIQVLSRRTKNNPILIGDPGVGKTALAEGISIKIIEKSVPDNIGKI